jgi:hypothetical protein
LACKQMRRSSKWRSRYEQTRNDHRTLYQICFHEAGQALAAYLRNCTIERIVVGRCDDSNLGGRCYWRSGDDKAIDPKTQIIVSLAAPAVDAFFGYRTNNDDYQDARQAAEQMGGDV